jgi:hypothetical protein
MDHNVKRRIGKMNLALKEFESYIEFYQSMKNVSIHYWYKPMEEGKFSIHDSISHLMMWDKYFFEAAIKSVIDEKPLTIQQLDFDEYNKNSVEYGNTLEKDDLIEMAIKYRKDIVEYIKLVPVKDYTKEYNDGQGKIFTIHEYLQDFIWHDNHHKKQIELFISSQAELDL